MAKRSTRRKAPRPRDETYAIRIGRWDWDYGFGTNNMRPTLSGNYLDFRNLKIFGRFLRPSRFAGRLLEATFFPEHNLRHLKFNEPPTAVGRIQPLGRTTNFEAILDMPEDALPMVLSMLLGERWQCLVLHATQFMQRSAKVQTYRFIANERLDEDLAEAS